MADRERCVERRGRKEGLPFLFPAGEILFSSREEREREKSKEKSQPLMWLEGGRDASLTFVSETQNVKTFF